MRYSKKYAVLVILFLCLLLISTFFVTHFTYAQNTGSADLFFSTPPKQIKEGERVTMAIEINSPLQSINAVSGVIYFPADLVRVTSLNKDKSIVNLWTQIPKLISNRIVFEGVILNPGFQNKNGVVFYVTLEARKTGKVNLNFSEGSILANDGYGTNIAANLGSTSFKIIPTETYFSNKPIAVIPIQKKIILPTITKYFPVLKPQEKLYLRGKGEPNALTKIIFQNVSIKSVGEKLVTLLQNEKKELGEVVIKNDNNGIFHYISSEDLIAGVYNATPFLVNQDKNIDIPGPSIQLLVNDSELVKNVTIVLNIMGLLIPIIFFAVIIYFIPWYSFRKMRLMKEKMLLEEEKIDLTAEELKRKSTIPNSPTTTPTKPVDNY